MHKNQFINITYRLLVLLSALFLNYCTSSNIVKAVYYHADEMDSLHEPCNHDIAGFIERDLSYIMHNPGGLGSFDGTYSDYNIL
jgi:hypothetical protein